jgi:hypothetical protein
MAYIPSIRILEEGGYEGLLGQQVYGLPSTWQPVIESKIIHEIIRLAQEAGVPNLETWIKTTSVSGE